MKKFLHISSFRILSFSRVFISELLSFSEPISFSEPLSFSEPSFISLPLLEVPLLSKPNSIVVQPKAKQKIQITTQCTGLPQKNKIINFKMKKRHKSIIFCLGEGLKGIIVNRTCCLINSIYLLISNCSEGINWFCRNS